MISNNLITCVASINYLVASYNTIRVINRFPCNHNNSSSGGSIQLLGTYRMRSIRNYNNIWCNTLSTSIALRIHTHIHTIHICTYIHTYIRTYVRMYVCTYVHIYIYTYIHQIKHFQSITHQLLAFEL